MQRTIVKLFEPFPSKTKIIILGGGFSGQHLANAAKHLGAKVLCSRRQAESQGADFVFDSKKINKIPSAIFEGATHLISCIPPQENGKDPVLNLLKQRLLETNLKWVGYLSTTGVYGDSQGKWVNESDTPKPQQARSIRRLSCEEEWSHSGLPVQILRLPGIYGPGRSAIDNIVKGNPKMIDKPGQVFSRIHIDDIAGAIIFLIHLSANGRNQPKIINISDDLPTSNIEVLSYACKLTGNDLPNIEKFDNAAKDMSPMALSFWQENRRVSNNLLCKKLGYSLIHPDYRSGLQDCFSQLQINRSLN